MVSLGHVSVCVLLVFNVWAVHGLRFGSFKGVPYLFNYTDGQDWCNPSFECDIMTYICEKLSDDSCELKIFNTLDQRLIALENDEVDIVVSRFSVSTEREKRVDFVRPYYYVSGAQIFSLPEDKQLFTSYDDLISQPVCMDLGYYAGSTLREEFGIFVFPSVKESLVSLISKGFCVASITDSAFIVEGLVQTDVAPIYKQPYAIAISKTPSIKNLYVDLQNVLLEMIQKEQGDLSFLQELEKKYIVSQGIAASSELNELGDAISENGGEQIQAEAEDKIWGAKAVTTSKRLAEQLFFIDPSYEPACREALNKIYESYQNGTKVGELPLTVLDNVMYTAVFGIDNPRNWIQTWNLYQHPFLVTPSTVQKISESNPQFPAHIQGVQNEFLSDEEHQVDGGEFFTVTPFDAADAFEGSSVQQSLLSPTRVVRTFLFKTIHQKNTDSVFDQQIMAACAVGENRNW